MLIQGQLKLYVYNSKKAQHVAFDTLQEDTVLGEEAVLGNQLHAYSAVSTKLSDLCFIAKEDLMIVIELFHDVAAKLAKDNKPRLQKAER